MSTREPSVEEIELWLRKVTRGNVPEAGEALIRGTQGWRFAKAGNAVGGILFEGSSAETGNLPIKMTAFDDKLFEVGTGGIIEDLDDSELGILLGGLYQVSALVEYSGFTQDSELQVRVNDIDVGISVVGAVTDVSTTLSAFGIIRLDLGDKLSVYWGRQSGGVWNATVFRLNLFAYSVFLDSIEDI